MGIPVLMEWKDFSLSLSPRTIEILNSETVDDSEKEDFPPRTSRSRYRNIKTYERKRTIELTPGTLNDYPSATPVLKAEDAKPWDNKLLVEDVEVQLPDPKIKILDAFKDDKTQEIIDLVSTIPDSTLELVLADIWDGLSDTNEKQKFLNVLSAHSKSSEIICSVVMLVEMLHEDHYEEMYQLIRPLIPSYKSCIASELFVPFIIEKASSIADDPTWFQELFPLLSVIQKSTLLSEFINFMDYNVQESHLKILLILLEEIPINETLFEKLTTILGRNMLDIQRDRSLGRILLILIEFCRTGIAINLINDFTEVCGSYKGIMRYRVQSALKKL